MAMISLDSLMGNQGPNYPEQIVAPYRKELADAGFNAIMNSEDLDNVMMNNTESIILIVLNSVCGCSARVSRPGAILSLFNHVVPDLRLTLFAGMEKDVVAHFRATYLAGVTPSSPNILVMKGEKVLLHLQRHQIETSDAGAIADQLINIYNQYCSNIMSEEKSAELRNYFKHVYHVDPLAGQL